MDEFQLWVQQRDVDRARQAFRAKCRAVLRQAYEEADQVSAAVGHDGTVDEVYRAWVQHVIGTLTGQLEAGPIDVFDV